MRNFGSQSQFIGHVKTAQKHLNFNLSFVSRLISVIFTLSHCLVRYLIVTFHDFMNSFIQTSEFLRISRNFGVFCFKEIPTSHERA